MNTILKLEQDFAMREADANYYKRLANDCHMEAGLLPSDLKEIQSGDLVRLGRRTTSRNDHFNSRRIDRSGN
jgi:hypothetical protein